MLIGPKAPSFPSKMRYKTLGISCHLIIYYESTEILHIMGVWHH